MKKEKWDGSEVQNGAHMYRDSYQCLGAVRLKSLHLTLPQWRGSLSIEEKSKLPYPVNHISNGQFRNLWYHNDKQKSHLMDHKPVICDLTVGQIYLMTIKGIWLAGINCKVPNITMLDNVKIMEWLDYEHVRWTCKFKTMHYIGRLVPDRSIREPWNANLTVQLLFGSRLEKTLLCFIPYNLMTCHGAEKLKSLDGS